MTPDERLAQAVRREAAKAPAPSPMAVDLLRRLGCPVVSTEHDERKSA